MVQSFRPVAERQGLRYFVELDEHLPATIVTDPHRLRQVLKNLLSNAFKFTERGEVALRLEQSTGGWSMDCESLTRATSVLAISIVDTGIGIRKDLQTAMFEAFAQADGTTARQHGGTGLGLSISRDLVGLLGGEITLVSEPGKGSTFTVYLPLDSRPAAPAPPAPSTAHAPAPAPAPAPPPRAPHPPADLAAAGNGFYKGSAAGATVLVVDDDFRNIFALTALLERGKLNVCSAQSGEDALAILDGRSDVAIVLMDIMMPVMNGYEAMAAIRERPAYAAIPIIAVTGKVVSGERERCIEAGASDYIPKPVDTAELLMALSKWFPAPPPVVVSVP
jgi:CheY-like chemotaxis protein